MKSRVRSGVAAVPGAGVVLAPVLRARAVALIARSGLFDREWYSLQRGRGFSGTLPAVRDYVDVGRRAGLSPHPLFEPAFVEPVTWATRASDPLAHYLLSRARQLHRDPHPLFDVSEYLRVHPAAARHPFGPLAHFLATATDRSPLPVLPGLLRHRAAPPTWGELRAAAVDAVTTWRTQQGLRAPRQVRHHDLAAEHEFRREVADAVRALRAAPAGAEAVGEGPLVSVILPTWNRGRGLRRAVQSVQAQTLSGWELVVVDDGSTDDTAAVLEGLCAFDPRVRVVEVPHGGVSPARNAGIAAARGELLAFLDSDNTWEPEFLELMVAGIRTRSLDFAYSAMRLERAGGTTWREFDGGREQLRVGNHIDLNVLVARTELVREIGGFDPTLRRTVDYDLVLRLADRSEPGYLPFVGAVYTDDDDPTRISRSEPPSWDTVVRARHALDWSRATPPGELVAGRVSVLLPIAADFQSGAAILGRLTADVALAGAPDGDAVVEPLDGDSLADSLDEDSLAEALDGESLDGEPLAESLDGGGDLDDRTPEVDRESQDLASEAPADPAAATGSAVLADVEILVLDRAGTRAGAAVLAAQALLDRRVRILRVPADTGFPFGADTLLIQATGAVSVLVQPSMTLEPGWLAALVAALEPGVVATAALVLEREGSIRSAGAVFDPVLDLPVPMLHGHPGSEALEAGILEVAAPLSPAIAARTADLVAVQGMDPLFTALLYDVDLGLRLAARSPGVIRTVAAATAIRTGPLPEDDPAAAADQKVFRERWAGRLPAGARAAWDRYGSTLAHLQVTTNEVGAALVSPVVVRPAHVADPVLFPALDRVGRPGGPDAAVPALRWAIMTAAPAGRRRRDWGDWYFAEALAAALRRLGQDAVINPRNARERPLGHLDDVVLTLRGLATFDVDPATTNLLWVISHPELVTPAEVAAQDAVFAASHSWSAEMTRQSGVVVEPLLQCTDPERFSPAAAAKRVVAGEAVLFVGNSRKVRRPVIEAAVAAGAELAVYGGGWHELIPDRMVRGRHLPNEELAAHYRSAGVVLNDHWDDMRVEGFMSNRLFDVVASGGRVISDRVPGIEEIFGDSVRTFDRRADLEHLLQGDPDEVFGPEDQRRATAERIAAEHSFDARAARLLEAALALRD